MTDTFTTTMPDALATACYEALERIRTRTYLLERLLLHPTEHEELTEDAALMLIVDTHNDINAMLERLASPSDA